MAITSKCSFYRNAENPSLGRGLGFCDLDLDRTTCDGNLRFCEKPDVLRKYILDRRHREIRPEADRIKAVYS
jgi:hypothetical protein